MARPIAAITQKQLVCVVINTGGAANLADIIVETGIRQGWRVNDPFLKQSLEDGADAVTDLSQLFGLWLLVGAGPRGAAGGGCGVLRRMRRRGRQHKTSHPRPARPDAPLPLGAE